MILPEDLHTTVHLTITEENAGNISEIIEKLSNLDINALSLSASPDQVETLQFAQEQAANMGVSLTWELPVPYSANHPVAFETTEDKIPDGAGKVWLYVEPDGDVLPAQGMAETILGNILRDVWQTIYPS